MISYEGGALLGCSVMVAIVITNKTVRVASDRHSHTVVSRTIVRKEETKETSQSETFNSPNLTSSSTLLYDLMKSLLHVEHVNVNN